MAEGEVGGEEKVETYVLIANTSPFAGEAVVTVMLEDTTTNSLTVTLAPNSRVTMPIGAASPYGFGAVVSNRRLGVLVESVGTGGNPPPAIVVERAMY